MSLRNRDRFGRCAMRKPLLSVRPTIAGTAAAFFGRQHARDLELGREEHQRDREAFFIGRSLHGQSFPAAGREERLAVHRAEPAVFTGAGFVGVEETEAARGAQTDGARLEVRVPEPNTLRAIRRRCGRGWDLRDMIHAALRSGSAAVTRRRMSRLLNWNEISAEARWRVRP